MIIIKIANSIIFHKNKSRTQSQSQQAAKALHSRKSSEFSKHGRTSATAPFDSSINLVWPWGGEMVQWLRALGCCSRGHRLGF